jgi:hypothetical protein
VAGYYLVEIATGSAWDHSRRRREQDGWDEHAQFMDALVDDGFVVLGGPTGEGEAGTVVLVVDAEGEPEVRRRLSADPWHADGHLRIEGVRSWSVWLRAE